MQPADKLLIAFFFCRDGETRTLDLVVPNDARYLAALHPEAGVRVKVIVRANILIMHKFTWGPHREQ